MSSLNNVRNIVALNPRFSEQG